MKKIIIFILLGLLAFVSTSCARDAEVASHNLSKAADMFELDRRIIFYNWITGQYMLTIEWKCSIKDMNQQLEVTCKVGYWQFKKHFLGLSDNVTYFAEQLYTKNVSVYHYEVVFKPQSIVPDIDFRWSLQDSPKTDKID